MQTTAVHIRKLGITTLRPLRSDELGHTLAGYVDGTARPAAVGRISRDASCRTRATITIDVHDPDRGIGVASALVERLAADARATGVTELTLPKTRAARSSYPLLRRIAAALCA